MTLAFENYFSAHHKLLLLPRRRKKTFIERKQFFATAEVWSLSSTWREISSSQNRKHSHTHSLTHTHTGRLLYPRYANAYARVMTTGVTRITDIQLEGLETGRDHVIPELTDPSFLANRASYWFVLLHISTVCGTLLT